MYLANFEKLVFNLRATNGKLEKQEILSKQMINSEEMKLFQMVLDPFQKFNVTAKGLASTDKKGYPKGCNITIPEDIQDLMGLLKALNTREISGMDAKQVCLHSLAVSGHSTTLLAIFDKDLKIGMAATEVNKAFKDFIPRFDVSLATKTTDKKNPDFLTQTLDKLYTQPASWTIQRKLDGVRVAMVCENGKATPYSRYGNEFSSLERVTAAIEKILPKKGAFVLDGEICVVNEDGSEDFSAAVSAIKRKEAQMENPKFVIFDAIPLPEFRAREGVESYKTRYLFLMHLLKDNPSPYYGAIQSFPFNELNFAKMMDVAKEKGWEGLMLKKNTIYKGRRTTDCYKVKNFEVGEYVVDSINIDTIQMPDPETKIKRAEETMKSINIIHKGTEVNVGSGWTVDQRREFYKNPEKIIGRTVSVQYQEESFNKDDDSISLRIPTIKYLWEDKRTV